MKSTIKVPDKGFMHGIRKSEVVQRIADGTGSQYHGFLTCPSGMPENNPFKSAKQRAFLAINKPEIAKKFAMHKGKIG